MSAQPSEDLVLRPLRREEYDRMVDQGMFVDEPIELLDGQLVQMSPEGSRHTGMIQELNWRLTRNLPEDVRVRVGHPWAADDISEPEPDIAIVPFGDYWDEHASEAILMVEVSSSSLARDLGLKARIYAAAGVPEYWVVDLRHDRVHVHTDPADDAHRSVEQHSFDTTLDAAGVPVRISDLLQP